MNISKSSPIGDGTKTVVKLANIDKTLTDEQRRRLVSYYEKQDAFEGYHFESKPLLDEDAGDTSEISLNYVRRYVEKLVRFTLGDKAFILDTKYQEYSSVLDYLNEIWDKNGKQVLATSMLRSGSYLGDVYLALEPSRRMLSTILLDPKQRKRIEDSLTIDELLEPDFLIRVIPALNGFPYYRQSKSMPFSEMFMFEYKEVRYRPTKKEAEQTGDDLRFRTPSERAFMNYINMLDRRATGQDDKTGGGTDFYVYKKIYYADRIEEWADNKLLETYKLDYGVVPVVHIPNKVRSTETPYGDDDITDIVPLNYEMNYKASDVSDIISYYQSPLTLFFGVGLDTIEKQNDRVLTGLPENAKVQNLEMKGDLVASLSYMDMLKQSMQEIFGVTTASLTGTDKLSNTSGIALHMQYEPLVERKLEKVTYLRGIEKLNLYMLYLAIFYDRIDDSRVKGKTPREVIQQHPKLFETQAFFTDTLPKDELLTLQKALTKIKNKMGTREDGLREMGESNPNLKLLEIETDQFDILRSDLITSLLDNITKQGVNSSEYAKIRDEVIEQYNQSSNSTKESREAFNQLLNDPLLDFLIRVNASNLNADVVKDNKDDYEDGRAGNGVQGTDVDKKIEMEQRLGTKEEKQARGKTQAIV